MALFQIVIEALLLVLIVSILMLIGGVFLGSVTVLIGWIVSGADPVFFEDKNKKIQFNYIQNKKITAEVYRQLHYTGNDGNFTSDNIAEAMKSARERYPLIPCTCIHPSKSRYGSECENCGGDYALGTKRIINDEQSNFE